MLGVPDLVDLGYMFNKYQIIHLPMLNRCSSLCNESLPPASHGVNPTMLDPLKIHARLSKSVYAKVAASTLILALAEFMSFCCQVSIALVGKKADLPLLFVSQVQSQVLLSARELE